MSIYIIERAPLLNKPGNWSPIEVSSTTIGAIQKRKKLKNDHPNETYRIMIVKEIGLIYLEDE